MRQRSSQFTLVTLGYIIRGCSTLVSSMWQRSPPISFCTISPSRRLDQAAIWAHLDPIHNMVKDQYPAVQHIHFFSDGPTSQYKQKDNFYMVGTEPYKKGFQFF